ncbi:F-box only protein 21 [Notechis scutatus]|uniref:F-box only protein 21 n=1 Tax=Notechis scutatus TaxID=8663 RepID=A0A6J1VHT9_9SAUR|nr:F-box only protein 21 [Notechis scutatus]
MAAAEREACEEAAKEAEEQRAGPGSAPAPAPLGLTELPGELLELILCCGSLGASDLVRLSCTCRHLREACQPRGKVWREQLRRRWPSLMKYYNQADSVNWLEQYKERHKAGLKAQTVVASFSKRFFSEHVPCDGFTDIETLDCPSHFFEDELMSILNTGGRKGLTWKYYAKKILYFLRQQNILKKLKTYLEYSADEQSFLEGAVLVDQYCNPLSDISLKSIQAQIDDIAAKVCTFLKSKNPRHPTVERKAGEALIVSQVELQRQVLDAMNCVLYEQLKYRGNEVDYYNCQNSYIHQVLIRRTGIPISLSVLYSTIAKQLGVQLEAVNFPSHFLLRWCQGKEGPSHFSLPFAENLELNPEPHEIPHPDIGRYFEEFADAYYVANPELAIRYPEDMALTRLAGQKTEESKE